ncbi:MAG: amino acid adenylation domain-containing protein [Acidobacteriota bacterium]
MSSETIEGYRLAPQQSRLWSFQEEDGAAAYRARARVAIDGPVDAGRLRRALDSVVRRHEILRTTFRRLAGMHAPLQVVNELLPIAFAAGSEAPTPIDPEAGPVLVASLERRSAEASELFLELPSLCADRSTLERLVFELGVLYEDPGAEGSLGDILQYADVTEWLLELGQKTESAPGIEYWRGLDLSAVGALALPFEEVPGHAARFDPRTFDVLDSAATANLVDGLCRHLDSTPRTLLLTCWQILLGRLVDDERLVVGYETDGRGLPELAAALGPCGRYLPLAGRAAEDSSLRVAVSRVEESIEEQKVWENVFAWNAQLPPGSPETPFFPFSFDYADRVSFPGGDAMFHVGDRRVVLDRFKVRLRCTRSGGALAVALDYDANRISAGEVERLGARFERLLESAAAEPESAVRALDILPEAEKRRLWFEWNDTRRNLDPAPILERFEDLAARFPERIAVVGERGRLTYSELNAQANGAAHGLREAGVAPDTIVGLCVERSVEMIVGVLAIWKAGGAYLPLDPSLPDGRLAFLLDDTKTSLVLTQAPLEERFSGTRAKTLLLEGKTGGAAANPVRVARADHLAYVIFTSGSTGLPKGVAVEHRQVANYVGAILEVLSPEPGEVFATVTTLAADLGNTSIFASLASGGTLRVLPESLAKDAAALAEDFEAEPVDYLKIVPSHLGALLSVARPERLLPRRCLVLGGEAASWDLIERVRGLAPGCTIVNHYGPTEATVGAAAFRIPSDLAGPRPRTVPIGRPLANYRVFLLDTAGRTAPLGTSGELHIGGAGLARGYLNRPELTEARFPTVEIAGEMQRLYKTGDVARYLPNGDIELLGRNDDQVKLHGFRIEPGEIEAALRRHPGVREAVVLAREVDASARRLVAYVVPEAAAEAPASAELRQFLRTALPEFMLPSAFVRVPRIPLTANGKVDRAALPLPDPARPDHGEPLVAPRTSNERILFKVWADVLRHDRFGIHENFFDLGGDSILGIQIVVGAAREGLRVTPRQLFDSQTIAELAEVAEKPIVHEGRGESAATGPFPLTPIQHWFFEQHLRDPHHFNQAMFLEGRELLDASALEAAVDLLVARHDALRLRFFLEADRWRQTEVESHARGVFSAVRLEGRSDAEQAKMIEEAADTAQASLDPFRGPLARALFFDLGPARPPRLLLVVHHLAVDAVSWRVLLEDLQVSYRQLLAGEPPHLGPKTASFRAWAEILNEAAASGVFDEESGYWQSRRDPAGFDVPFDFEGENTVASERSVESLFSREETSALLTEVPGIYRTRINDVLLAALADALTPWTGSRVVSIVLEGHGREEIAPGIDVSRTVGWFTSRFPVLLEVPEAADPGEKLVAVKEQLRAVPRNGIGYGVFRYLGPTDRLGASPDPSVSFNYLGQLDRLLPEDSLWKPLASVPGAPRSARNRRRYPLSIEGMVRDGRLRFSWLYSENLHRRETVAALAERFEVSLRAILLHCRTAEPRYTPSDFPGARMSSKDLETLVARMKPPTAGR